MNQKYKSIFKKKKNKHTFRKNLRVEVLTFKALLDSYISYDKLVLINNVLKEYDRVKEKIYSLKTSSAT